MSVVLRCVVWCASVPPPVQDVLFFKSVAELLEASAKGDSQFGKPIFWIVLVLAFVTILMQLHFIAQGLTYFDATYVVPVFQSIFVTCSILAGAIYFREFAAFSALQTICFGAGWATTMLGVGLLSTRSVATPTAMVRAAAALEQVRRPGAAAPFLTPRQGFVCTRRRTRVATDRKEPTAEQIF